MFWNDYSGGNSVLGGLIDREKFTLADLLEHDDILQECKSQNKKLLEFLEERSTLENLIELMITEPAADEEPTQSYRRPALACEIIVCGLPRLIENMTADDGLLEKLFSFLDADPPLNPLLASFFSKTFQMLLTHQHGQDWYSYQISCLRVLEFSKSRPTFLTKLLEHLGTSAIMDVVQCLIHTDVCESKKDLLGWLDSQKFIERLIGVVCGRLVSLSSLSTEISTDSLEIGKRPPSPDPEDCSQVAENNNGVSPQEETSPKPDVKAEAKPQDQKLLAYRSENASNLLCDLIVKGREAADYCSAEKVNPLLNRCSERATVDYLLSSMFSAPVEFRQTAIINGIQVLLALLNVSLGPVKPPLVDANEILRIAEAIAPYFTNLREIIVDTPVNLECGYSNSKVKPVGAIRLAAIHLVEVTLHLDSSVVPPALVESKIMPALINMFVEYKWNNFLHAYVVNMIRKMFEATPYKELYSNHLFVDCMLIDKVVTAWEDNDVSQKLNKPRHGYMGHLIQIANNIQDYVITYPDIMNKVTEKSREDWPQLVSLRLDEINKVQNVYLGGLHPIHSNNSDHHNQQDYDHKVPIQEINFDDDDDNSDLAKQFKSAEQLFVFMCQNASNSMGGEPISSKYDHLWDQYGIFNINQDDPDDANIASNDMPTSLTFNSSTAWKENSFANPPTDWADFSCFESSDKLAELQKISDPFATFEDSSFQIDKELKELLSVDDENMEKFLNSCDGAPGPSEKDSNPVDDTESIESSPSKDNNVDFSNTVNQIDADVDVSKENLSKELNEVKLAVDKTSSSEETNSVKEGYSEKNKTDKIAEQKINNADSTVNIAVENKECSSDSSEKTVDVDKKGADNFSKIVHRSDNDSKNPSTDSHISNFITENINAEQINILSDLLQKWSIISKDVTPKEDLSVDYLANKVLSAESLNKLGELLDSDGITQNNIADGTKCSAGGDSSQQKLTPAEMNLCRHLKEHISSLDKLKSVPVKDAE